MFELPVPKPTAQPWKALLYASAFIKNHEKLVAVVLAAALVWGVAGKINNAIEAHDKRVLTADAAKQQADTAAAVAQATINAKATADYKALLESTAAANQQLQQANLALTTALAKQQATDAHLAPLELAARIETLAALPTNSVTPNASGYAVTSPAAVSIAQHLESIPALQAEAANDKLEIANGDKLLVAQTARVDGLNSEIDKLGIQIKDNDKVCKDQIAVVKAEGRKSKSKIAKIAFVAGFIAAEIFDHAILKR